MKEGKQTGFRYKIKALIKLTKLKTNVIKASKNNSSYSVDGGI
jgi:hypothetical protein